MKYSFCGGFAFAVDMVTFFLAAWLLFPALKSDEFLVRLFQLNVPEIPEAARAVNFIICSGLAFMISNFVAYVLNVLFVFKSGKHGRWKELGLFYLVSGISIAIGTAIGAVLVYAFELAALYSYVAKAVSTTLINFVARKFFIFDG